MCSPSSSSTAPVAPYISLAASPKTGASFARRACTSSTATSFSSYWPGGGFGDPPNIERKYPPACLLHPPHDLGLHIQAASEPVEVRGDQHGRPAVLDCL